MRGLFPFAFSLGKFSCPLIFDVRVFGDALPEEGFGPGFRGGEEEFSRLVIGVGILDCVRELPDVDMMLDVGVWRLYEAGRAGRERDLLVLPCCLGEGGAERRKELVLIAMVF